MATKKEKPLAEKFAEAKGRVEGLKKRPSNDQLLELYALLQAGDGRRRDRVAAGDARPEGAGEVRRLGEGEGDREGRRDEEVRRARRQARRRARLKPAVRLLEELRAEHELIDRVAGSLRTFAAARARGEGGPADGAAFRRFFRLWAGAWHHAREEETLFPALAAKAELSPAHGPIAAFVEQHHEMAKVLDELDPLLDREPLGADDARRLVDLVTAYTRELGRHIDAENSVLLPESEVRLRQANVLELEGACPDGRGARGTRGRRASRRAPGRSRSTPAACAARGASSARRTARPAGGSRRSGGTRASGRSSRTTSAEAGAGSLVDDPESSGRAVALDPLQSSSSMCAFPAESPLPDRLVVPSPFAGLERPRILVVDDAPESLNYLSACLSQAGMDTDTAACGERALEILEEGSFEAVLTDVRMPRMSGVDLLLAVRERDADLPVVLVSGCPEEDLPVRAMELAPGGLLLKPVNPESSSGRCPGPSASVDWAASRAGRPRLRAGPVRSPLAARRPLRRSAGPSRGSIWRGSRSSAPSTARSWGTRRSFGPSNRRCAIRSLSSESRWNSTGSENSGARSGVRPPRRPGRSRVRSSSSTSTRPSWWTRISSILRRPSRKPPVPSSSR